MFLIFYRFSIAYRISSSSTVTVRLSSPGFFSSSFLIYLLVALEALKSFDSSPGDCACLLTS